MWKFWLSLVAGILCLLVWMGMRGEAAESEHWPTTAGVITRMNVSEHTDRDGSRTKHLDVRYKYAVNGREFEGDRVGVGTSYDTDAVAQAYPVGKQVLVFYNPEKPADAVLQTGASGTTIWALGGFGLLFLSFFLFREARRKRRPHQSAPPPAATMR